MIYPAQSYAGDTKQKPNLSEYLLSYPINRTDYTLKNVTFPLLPYFPAFPGNITFYVCFIAHLDIEHHFSPC